MAKERLIILIVSMLIILSGASGCTQITTENQNSPETNNSIGFNATASATTFNIDLRNFAFSPTPLNIHVGDMVIWTNNDPVPHTITSDSGGEMNSPTLSNGKYIHIHLTQQELSHIIAAYIPQCMG